MNQFRTVSSMRNLLGGDGRTSAGTGSLVPNTDSLQRGSNNSYDQQVRDQLWDPPPIVSAADTGLSDTTVRELLLKHLLQKGDAYGSELADLMCLPFNGVVSEVLEFYKREHKIEVTGADGIGEARRRYALTEQGITAAENMRVRSSYIGPAPVSLSQYVHAIHQQTSKTHRITQEHMREAMKHLLVNSTMLDRLGPGGQLRSVHLHVRPARQRQDGYVGGGRQNHAGRPAVDTICDRRQRTGHPGLRRGDAFHQGRPGPAQLRHGYVR